MRAFLESAARGEPWTPVTLPHDAMLGQDRDPAAGPASGYFPGGVWEDRKTFVVPESDADSRVIIEFEGVCRDAVVYVNGDLAGRRSYGYSGFHVDADPLLRLGAENETPW